MCVGTRECFLMLIGKELVGACWLTLIKMDWKGASITIYCSMGKNSVLTPS